MKKFMTILLIILIISISACKPSQPEIPRKTNGDLPEEPTQTMETSFDQPCKNVLYPLIRDNQWVYQLDYSGQSEDLNMSKFAISVSKTTDSMAEIGILDYDTGVVTKSEVLCSDGSIINFPFTELNMLLADVEGNLNLEYVSGIFIPSKSDFDQQNWENSWRTEYSASGVIHAEMEGEKITAELNSSSVTMDWKVVSTGDSVNTIAGSFNDVVSIERSVSIDIESMQAEIEGTSMNLSTTLKIDSILYFAPNIGLIKQDIENATVRFFGVDFPVGIGGSMELLSYHLAE